MDMDTQTRSAPMSITKMNEHNSLPMPMPKPFKETLGITYFRQEWPTNRLRIDTSSDNSSDGSYSSSSSPPISPNGYCTSPVSNSQVLKDTVDLLLYCYREHGVNMRSEELKRLVDVFACQLYESFHTYSHNNDNTSSPTKPSLVPSSSSPLPLSIAGRKSVDCVDSVMCGDSFSCPLCYGILVDPVTTQCGHTYCKKCLQRESVGQACRRCLHVFTNADILYSKSNVLIGSLVEKWWPTEVNAHKLRTEGNQLFDSQRVDEALIRYTQALELVSDDHLTLGNRSNALLTAGRSEEALQDAEAAIKSCPKWSKAYFRKSAALISLGRYEEAFLNLTSCMYLIQQTTPSTEDPAMAPVTNEMGKILHKIFIQSSVGSSHKRHSNDQHQFTPYPVGSGKILCGRKERRRGLCNWNDLDHNNNSSGDEVEQRFLAHPYHSSKSTSNATKNMSWKSTRIHEPKNTPHYPKTTLSPVKEQSSVKINRLFGRASQELKAFEQRLKSLHKNSRYVNTALVSSTDVECSLCYRLLFQPVSTGCGHTFCRSCLDRCLDHNASCPLCKTSLQSYLANRDNSLNEFLESIICELLPNEFEERLNQHLEEIKPFPSDNNLLDGDIPIFVCTMAFPTVPCPLHVFEPRYRLMIRRCMENGSNRFGMCCYVSEGENNYGNIGTLLEIKNIQYFSDGRSVVDTMGRRRFKVVQKSQVDGYNAAKIELLHDRAIDQSEIQVVKSLHDKVLEEADEWLQSIGHARRQRIHSHFGMMPQPEENWLDSPDGPSWTWWLLAILPLDSKAQFAILSMCCLQKRLECILKVLNFVRNRMDSIGE